MKYLCLGYIETMSESERKCDGGRIARTIGPRYQREGDRLRRAPRASHLFSNDPPRGQLLRARSSSWLEPWRPLEAIDAIEQTEAAG